MEVEKKLGGTIGADFAMPNGMAHLDIIRRNVER